MTHLLLYVPTVLCAGKMHENGVHAIQPECVAALNSVLVQAPNARIVLLYDNEPFRGVNWYGNAEWAFCSHGIAARGRVRDLRVGRTEADIRDWATQRDARFAVLDDLPLDLPELVQIDPATGLTDDRVAEIVARLRGEM